MGAALLARTAGFTGLLGCIVACGSADAGGLSSRANGTPTSAGGTTASGSGGFTTSGGSGGVLATGFGGVVTTPGSGGLPPFGGNVGSGGADAGRVASGSGDVGGAGGAVGGTGGAAFVPLPAGGIISLQCAQCADAGCTSQVSACMADSACATTMTCLTRCLGLGCVACVGRGSPAGSPFNLLRCCTAKACNGTCPTINLGGAGTTTCP